MSELVAALVKQLSDQQTQIFVVEALSNAEEEDWSDILEGFSVVPDEILEIMRAHPDVPRRALAYLSGSKVDIQIVGLAGPICELKLVEVCMRVRDLKELVYHESEIAASDQKLFVDGDVLRDDSFLFDRIIDDTVVTLMKVLSDFQACYDGRISRGGTVLREVMTVEEAKDKAMLLPDCVGFCFRGDGSKRPVEVLFKNKFDNIPIAGWTSFRTMRGLTARELRACGRTVAELVDFAISASDLRLGGYLASELLEAGYAADDVLLAGYGVGELREAGFTAQILKQSGYSVAQLVHAKFPITELRDAGCSLEELWGPLLRESSNFDVVLSLRRANYTASELSQLGCDPCLLIRAGYNKASDLRQAGCTAAQLTKSGYTASGLMERGCSAEDVVRIGFTLNDLRGNGRGAEARRLIALSNVNSQGKGSRMTRVQT